MNEQAKLQAYKRVRLINLTHHAIMLQIDELHQEILPPSGFVARCKVTRKPISTICWNKQLISINIVVFSEVVGLPEPALDIYYVVSKAVAEAKSERTDLLFPDHTIRDVRGRVIACRSFGCISRPQS